MLATGQLTLQFTWVTIRESVSGHMYFVTVTVTVSFIRQWYDMTLVCQLTHDVALTQSHTPENSK